MNGGAFQCQRKTKITITIKTIITTITTKIMKDKIITIIVNSDLKNSFLFKKAIFYYYSSQKLIQNRVRFQGEARLLNFSLAFYVICCYNTYQQNSSIKAKTFYN